MIHIESMDSSFFYFLKGVLVGASVAIPIGPVAIYCIRQTMTYGLLSGLAAGLGASIADGFYSWIAAISSQFVNHFMDSYAQWFYLGGGSFLIYLGITIFLNTIPDGKSKNVEKKNLLASFTSTLFLTIASPMTTLLFIGMFTTYGVFAKPLTSMDIVQLVGGVSVGALTWWIILTTFLNFVHGRYNIKLFRYINRVSGAGIFGYGLYTLSRFFF